MEAYSNENTYPRVEYNLYLLNKNTTSPFGSIELGCNNPTGVTFELVYNGGKYGKLAVIHGVDRRLFERMPRSYYLIGGSAAIDLDNFIVESLKSGDYKFEFEAVAPEKPSRYASKAVADLGGYEAAKRLTLANCVKQKQELDRLRGRTQQQAAESAPTTSSNDLVGRWSLGGVGGSASLLFEPNGKFTFSYVQSFSRQTVKTVGSWQSDGGRIELRGLSREPAVCTYIGDRNTKYLANCALTGVMSRLP